MSAIEIHNQLQALHHERALASIEGLGRDSAYFSDLEQEITVLRAAYVLSAVTEIARLRADLSGPLLG
jgi:hypothetical protein